MKNIKELHTHFNESHYVKIGRTNRPHENYIGRSDQIPIWIFWAIFFLFLSLLYVLFYLLILELLLGENTTSHLTTLQVRKTLKMQELNSRDKYLNIYPAFITYQWGNTRIIQNFLQSADLFYNILLTLLNSTWTDHRISPEITRPVTCIFAYWPVRCRIREFKAVLHFTNPFVDCIIVLCP